MWERSAAAQRWAQTSAKAHLFPILITSISSIAVSVLLLISSALVNIVLNLYGNEETEKLRRMCDDNQLKEMQDFQQCEYLSRWNICSWLGIIIGTIQLAVSTFSLNVRVFERKTNMWCAIHGLVFVTMAPVAILTLLPALRADNPVFPYTSLKIFFASMSTVDAVFAALSIAIISLVLHSSDRHPQYTLLVN